MQTAIARWLENPVTVKWGSAALALTIMLFVMGWIRSLVVGRLTDNNMRYQARKAITIASIAGWVAVSFGGFYRVGDRVELGGIKGDVIDIGILRTTVMQMGE